MSVSIEPAETVDFDGAARIARRLIDQTIARDPSRPALLNVNVPDLSKGPPKGVKVVPQSLKGWRESWERRTHPRGGVYYWMVGEMRTEEEGAETDVAALADRYVTVTPLRFDLTDHGRLDDVRRWGLRLD
jgi:5'-nucleotidase